MSNRESHGKQEKTQRKGLPSSPNFSEDDKKDKRNLTGSWNSAALVRRVSAEKRKLKSDHTDIRFCPMKRRPEAKRPYTEADDALRKRSKVTTSSQGPVKHQEASHSATGLGVSQSPSSNGTNKGPGRGPEFKPRDTQLANIRRKLDSGMPGLGTPKGPEAVKPKANSLVGEQKSVTKEAKLERLTRAPSGSGKCIWEKHRRMQSAERCGPDPLSQEPLDPRRKKINFKIPLQAHSPLQKRSEQNTFRPESQAGEKKGSMKDSQGSPKAREPRHQLSFAGPVSKVAICEWTRRKHELRGRRKSSSGGKVSERFEVPCSSVSPENSQDTDEEMQIVEELHAARVGKSVDLPAVPATGELMSMEIDLVEEDVPPPAANTALDKKLLIVIDTNILMNHLKFVKSLKTTEIPGFDGLVLIIPWVVVQELDRMKAGKLLKHAQHKAIPVVHFIHDGLREPDRKLWGQPLQLASQRLYGLSDENNDDRVLKCCLQYQELFPCSLVVLCTDDRNLRSKGLISGVKSLSKEELSAECRSLSLNSDSSQPGLPLQPVKTETKTSEGSPKEDVTDSEHALQLDDLMSQLEKSLGSALSSILETEMKLAFGDLWMEVLYLKPPWTLLHLLQCFRKHWLAVFGLAVENSLLATVESLYDNLAKASKAMDLATVKFLLQDSKSLLLAFSTRSNYDGILPQAFAHVTRLLHTFSEVKATLHPAPPKKAAANRQEGAPKSHGSAPPAPANRHQEIWSILEKVWITIYQNSTGVFQRLGSDSPPTSSKIVALEEAFLSLQKLMTAVKDILEGIQRSVLMSDSLPKSFTTVCHWLSTGRSWPLAAASWRTWSVPCSSATHTSVWEPSHPLPLSTSPAHSHSRWHKGHIILSLSPSEHLGVAVLPGR